MTTRVPARPCSTPQCRHNQPCPVHHRTHDRRRPTAWRRGYDRVHQELRPVILARDPMCCGCCWAPSTVMEHAIPLEQGGETNERNCWGACKGCADFKTGVERRDRTFGHRLRAAGALEQHVVPWGWRAQRAFGGEQ